MLCGNCGREKDAAQVKTKREEEMTQHPSLKGGKTGGKFRSVLKRYEKIKDLDEKEKWDNEKGSVYSLPKIKRLKFKVKKTKGPAEEKEGEEGAGVAATGTAAGAKPAEAAAPKKEKKGK
ncbi:MAG: small basic protein [Candidatus Omnitrophota bacterium]